MNIVFSPDKLTKSERKAYDAMTPYEQSSYAKTWTLLEEQKVRLAQKVNASKERNAREQKALMERARKERTHRLIERGAIVESFIANPDKIDNEAFKNMLIDVFNNSSTQYILQQYMGLQNNPTEDPVVNTQMETNQSMALS